MKKTQQKIFTGIDRVVKEFYLLTHFDSNQYKYIELLDCRKTNNQNEMKSQSSIKNIGLNNGDLTYRYFYLYRHCRSVQAKQGTPDFLPALDALKQRYYETCQLNEKYKKMSMNKQVVCKYVEPTVYKQIIDKFVAELGIEPYKEATIEDLEF